MDVLLKMDTGLQDGTRSSEWKLLTECISEESSEFKATDFASCTCRPRDWPTAAAPPPEDLHQNDITHRKAAFLGPDIKPLKIKNS